MSSTHVSSGIPVERICWSVQREEWRREGVGEEGGSGGGGCVRGGREWGRRVCERREGVGEEGGSGRGGCVRGGREWKRREW